MSNKLTIVTNQPGFSEDCFISNKNLEIEITSLDNAWSSLNPGPYKLSIETLDANGVEVSSATNDNLGTYTESQIEDYKYIVDFNPGIYTVTYTITCLDNNVSDSTQILLSICSPLDLVKTSCYQYSLYRPTGINTPILSNGDDISFDVKLYKFGEQTPILSETWDVVNTDTLSLTLEKDGVYLLKLIGDNDTFEYPIFEFCKLEYCYIANFQKLFCDDYSCQPCENDSKKKDKEAIRFALNRIIALASVLFSHVYRDKIQYLGLLCIDNCRFNEITTIQGQFDKLNEVLKNCGDCFDSGCEDAFYNECQCSDITYEIIFSKTMPTIGLEPEAIVICPDTEPQPYEFVIGEEVDFTSGINYTNGNGATYGSQSLFSINVSGLTLTIDTTTLALNGPGVITYTIIGTPGTEGQIEFVLFNLPLFDDCGPLIFNAITPPLSTEVPEDLLTEDNNLLTIEQTS